MKKIVTLFEIESIDMLKDHCDGFLVGQDLVSTRLTRSFDVNEIKQIAEKSASFNKECFIMMNRILHDKDEHHYEAFIRAVDSPSVTGYVAADIGVLTVLKRLGLSSKMIYNPETLLTNVFDVFYYREYGIKGAFLAKEITLEDIISIGSNRPFHLFMYIHGYLNMFYSKRQLIEAYFENKQTPNLYHNQRNLTVVEEKRPEFRYKALEDEAGTHIFRENVFSGIDYQDQLKNAVDYVIIDTIFHDDLYALEVLKCFLDPNESSRKRIQQQYQEKWDTGFFFKKTVYKPKKVTI
ncbi:MAG: U32 family peptidase [Acholeplasma sp.]|nr:U32 family peptidase [Acholeplasma sp.]